MGRSYQGKMWGYFTWMKLKFSPNVWSEKRSIPALEEGVRVNALGERIAPVVFLFSRSRHPNIPIFVTYLRIFA